MDIQYEVSLYNAMNHMGETTDIFLDGNYGISKGTTLEQVVQ